MKVFIGCAAQENINEKYINLAHNVSEILSSNDYDLVFGAWNKSMMGECYYTFLNNGRKVTSCVPTNYIDDLKNLSESEHIIYNSSISRCEGLYELADLIVILPGGLGTLSELMAMVEEYRSSKSEKEMILFNYEGYYDDIIKFEKEKKSLGFISTGMLDVISVVKTEEDFEYLIGGLNEKFKYGRHC